MDQRHNRTGIRLFLTRRDLMLLLGVAALWLSAAISALAQDRTTLPLVAMLRVNTPETVEPMATSFRNALAALGQVDGRNIRLESRLADGRVERLPGLAQSLVRDNPAVIVAVGEAPTRAAQRETTTVPIVTMADDIVESGFIATLARPGGNITGLSILGIELDAKKIDLLKQILPPARRIGVLRDPSTSGPARMQAISEMANALGVELQIVDIRAPDDLAGAFASFVANGAEAIDVLASPLLFSLRKDLGRLSLTHRLPAICQFRENVEAGCLASYGISLPRAYLLLADLTDKVLRGAKPADVPAQQPTRVELVVNQKAARAIGIEIPLSILQRADEVIE
jgi:putative tryptophan/tyrosine transport system substrate-binding protein